MRVKKRVKIMAWELWYWVSGIVKDHKLRKINIYDEGLWGVKTIRNDLLAKAFLYKDGGSK